MRVNFCSGRDDRSVYEQRTTGKVEDMPNSLQRHVFIMTSSVQAPRMGGVDRVNGCEVTV